MPPTPITLNLMHWQTLVDGQYSSVKIHTVVVQESELSQECLANFDLSRPIGISPRYAPSGALIALAIADNSICRIVEFQNGKRNRHGTNSTRSPTKGRELLQKLILCRPDGDLFAFDLAPLSMSLYNNLGLRLTRGVDIQSAFRVEKRKHLDTIKAAVGDAIPIMEDNIIELFRPADDEQGDRKRITELAQRAWISQFLAYIDNTTDAFAKVPRIDTEKLTEGQLDIIAKFSCDALRLDQIKPDEVKHDFKGGRFEGSTSARISSERYKNRIRPGQKLSMTIGNGSGSSGYSVPGQVSSTRGRSSTISPNPQWALAAEGIITSLTTVGREDPTAAEEKRAAIVLQILQGDIGLLTDNPWIQNIWFPSDGSFAWPAGWNIPTVVSPSGNLGRHNLNDSQQQAVQSMLSMTDSHRLCLIQGPPGTGKTTVIATFVQLARDAGYGGIWLVAQSNVAVKNIAEKLATVGFLDWRLLVSKDFLFEWHEHLYSKIKDNIIASDAFNSVSSRIRGCQVILCTLSMLSNLNIPRITSTIPLRLLVVDEASQIEIGDYLSTFTSFWGTLRKICFIGDDKQLPPHGQEELNDLQSIFEVTHLRPSIVFLDTQYRMPPQLGNFISDAVYEGRLLSNPRHPVTDDIIACRFIDVEGREKRKMKSFVNDNERDAVLKLAQQLQDQGKTYRIITPYEAQRSEIESAMKANGLDWGNKCFSVDSFQGNEEDYIIISVVRSQELGFLKNLRRTNVMLTRCKRGMFIVSSLKFLSGAGAKSLVGGLARTVGEKAWLKMEDINTGNF